MLKLFLPEASFRPWLCLVQTQHLASCLNFTSTGRHIPFCATLIPAKIYCVPMGVVFWVHRFQTIQGASLVYMGSVVQAEASQASLGCLLKTRPLFLPKTGKASSCLLARPHSFLLEITSSLFFHEALHEFPLFHVICSIELLTGIRN